VEKNVNQENEYDVTKDTDERGLMKRDTFEGGELMQQAETSSTAAAETAKALVQARYIMALRRPRNADVSAQKIMSACKRPRFAMEVEYAKPVGGKTIHGPSIRFADEAIKLWGNVDIRTMTTYEDDMNRKILVEVTDLETNVSKSQEIIVRKTIERRTPTAGREVIGKRKNKQGAWVYLIKANDDEILNKENANIAKARRNLQLQLIPQDIIDEAVEVAQKIRGQRDAEDPKAAKKKLLSAFSGIGVMPNELETFVGHSLDQLSNTELDSLRAVYASIQQGEASWKDFLLDAIESAKTQGDPSPSSQAVHDRIKNRISKTTQNQSSAPEAVQEHDSAPDLGETITKPPEDDLGHPPPSNGSTKVDQTASQGDPPSGSGGSAEKARAPDQGQPSGQAVKDDPGPPLDAQDSPGAGSEVQGGDFLGFDSPFLNHPERYPDTYRVEIGGQSSSFRESLLGSGWEYGVKHGFGRKYFRSGLKPVDARNWFEYILTLPNPDNEEGDGAIDAKILFVEIVSEATGEVIFTTKE
jgi:hypothetical protein